MSEKPTICRHGCLRRSCETCNLLEDVERLERERDQALDALRELVRLKDLHDRIESYGNPVFTGLYEMIDEYKRSKPLAWARARAILDAMDAKP